MRAKAGHMSSKPQLLLHNTFSLPVAAIGYQAMDRKPFDIVLIAVDQILLLVMCH